MRIKVQVMIDAEDGGKDIVREVVSFNRQTLSPEGLGLTVEEAKNLLQGVQKSVVTQQIADQFKNQSPQPSSDQKRPLKGTHSLVGWGLFGTLRLSRPCFYWIAGIASVLWPVSFKGVQHRDCVALRRSGPR